MSDTTTAEVPDLTSALMTDAAGEAAAAVMARRTEPGTTVRLGSLTDEELVAALGSVETAAPLGRWFTGLDEATAGAVRAAALRSLASREEVVFAPDEHGEVVPHVGQRLLGLLRLRLEPARLVVESLAGSGTACYVLRQGAAGWMRELVSRDGFHTFDLLDLDDGEADTFGAAVGVGAEASASDVDLVQPAQGEAPAEVAAFLAEQEHVAQVTLTSAEGETTGLVVCVAPDGALTLGRPTEDGGLRYVGATAPQLREVWDTWRAGQ